MGDQEVDLVEWRPPGSGQIVYANWNFKLQPAVLGLHPWCGTTEALHQAGRIHRPGAIPVNAVESPIAVGVLVALRALQGLRPSLELLLLRGCRGHEGERQRCAPELLVSKANADPHRSG